MHKVLKNLEEDHDCYLVNAIDSFCDYLFTTNPDFTEIGSVIATLRIIGCELDRLVSSGIINGSAAMGEAKKQIMDTIYKDVKASGPKLNITKYMPTTNKNKELDEKEIKYMKYITSRSTIEDLDREKI